MYVLENRTTRALSWIAEAQSTNEFVIHMNRRNSKFSKNLKAGLRSPEVVDGNHWQNEQGRFFCMKILESEYQGVANFGLVGWSSSRRRNSLVRS